MRHTLLVVAAACAAFSCSSTPQFLRSEASAAQAEEAEASSATAEEPAAPPTPQAPADGDDETAKPELGGVFVPVDFEAVSLWPEAYSGEMLVLEVAPHGSTVAAGDVIARLKTRSIDETIADAERGLVSARIAHEGLRERNAVAEEGAASKLARAEAGLDRARRALEGYETQELAFSARGDELQKQRSEAWIADQVDELEQLEAMYEADELTDATEEIVLKRSRRDLALSRASSELSKDQRAYKVDHTQPLTRESKREDVARKTEELAHLRRTQAVDAEGRKDGFTRSEAELAKKVLRLERLKRDRELLTVKAPRAGVVLHGSLRALRAGGAPSHVRRGRQLAKRADVFLVADPEQLAVAVDVSESNRATFGDGTQVVVKPVGGDAKLIGTLSVGAYPAGAKAGESTFEGTVELADPVPGVVAGMHAKVSPAEPER